jgi:hypothetical protein
MAQTSTTILASKDHIANIGVATDISFSQTGVEYKISASSTSLSALNVRDLITVSGSTSNNSTFTVKEVETNGTYVIVEEAITTEAAGDSVTIDHVGFVSDKFKGDGYHSQPDGIHTIAYKVNTTLTGSIKMQGSLTSSPTEDDWFNISDTTFTADQSTTIATYNFTGNFVWVRAKATSVTAGTITSILLNN